jgi:hypothetical protein
VSENVSAGIRVGSSDPPGLPMETGGVVARVEVGA